MDGAPQAVMTEVSPLPRSPSWVGPSNTGSGHWPNDCEWTWNKLKLEKCLLWEACPPLILAVPLPPLEWTWTSLLEDGESTWRQRSWLSQLSQTTHIRPRESAARKARRTEHCKAKMLKALNSAQRLIKRRIGKCILFRGSEVLVHLNKSHFISEMGTRDRVR